MTRVAQPENQNWTRAWEHLQNGDLDKAAMSAIHGGFRFARENMWEYALLDSYLSNLKPVPRGAYVWSDELQTGVLADMEYVQPGVNPGYAGLWAERGATASVFMPGGSSEGVLLSSARSSGAGVTSFFNTANRYDARFFNEFSTAKFLDDFHYVGVHGSPNGSMYRYIEAATNATDVVTVQRVVRQMVQDGYKGGPAVLVSCYSGLRTGRGGSMLSAVIDNMVFAPTGQVIGVERQTGGFIVQPFNAESRSFPSWNLFDRGKLIKGVDQLPAGFGF